MASTYPPLLDPPSISLLTFKGFDPGTVTPMLPVDYNVTMRQLKAALTRFVVLGDGSPAVLKNLPWHEVSRLEITNRTWLERIPALCSVDADVDTCPRNKAWQALHWLGEIPYWERVWIIQETVLAQVLVIFCGKES
jgi:hypothetical protein